MAIDDITTGENSITRFLIAKKVLFESEKLENRIGTKTIKMIPKINERIATGFENL